MSATTTPGALPGDWSHWQKLGLTADLLPVVSKPNAAISPNSTLKALGKTPSMYNRDRLAVGIKDWTRKQSTDKEIGRWSQELDYGICIITGRPSGVCVFDTDIVDPIYAQRIEDAITAVLGPLPCRYRNNSGKRVLMFRMRGQFAKRVITTAHGPIEFLATGQQFIACGQHPSGARYEWRHEGGAGLPDDIPEVTPAEFAAVWQCLQDAHGIEPESIARGGLIRSTAPRAAMSTQDDTAAFLDGNGWVKSYTTDGRLNINCPFKDEHTSDSGDTETQYFPAGVGVKEDGTPFALGHFDCKHAHCSKRKDSDFLDAIGIMASEFEDVSGQPAVVVVDGVEVVIPPKLALPAFTRKRDGTIKATLSNLLMALRRPDVCQRRIGWDEFRDELMWASRDAGVLDWRPFGDHDYTVLREYLENNGCDPFTREMVRDAVYMVARENRFDSAQLWLGSLPKWDGASRVLTFFSRYFGAKDNAYTQACGMYCWSALAGRVMDPGCQADMAFILKSAQGTRKTTGIRLLSPSEEAFGEFDLAKHDDALARGMRGVLVAELSELKGLNSRESEAIKSWVSRRWEKWVPKFKEFVTIFPRRFIAFGSTNEQEVLADSTGERRWLPMAVGEADTAALKADRDQLWAEGLMLWEHGGVHYAEAERLAQAEHHKFKVQDSWLEPVVGWLNEEKFGDPDGRCNGDFPVGMVEVLQGALGKKVGDIGRKDELRVAHLLRLEGFERRVVRYGGSTLKKWVKGGGGSES